MKVTVYRLREQGRPLSYAEIKARPALRGLLVYGTWGNPEQHAKLITGDKLNPPTLLFASLQRASNDCLLFIGFQPGPTLPRKRQTWLCATDEQAGEVALRKLRPPKPGDMPLGGDDDLPA